MRRIEKILFMIGVALFSAAPTLFAQPEGVVSPNLTNEEFSYYSTLNPWVNSVNPTGLLKFSGENLNFAEAQMVVNNGDLYNYSGSPKSTEYCVGSKSIYRFSPNLVVYGAISYTNFTGEDMTGSVFLNPYTRPFDIMDITSSFAGQKQLELFDIESGIGFQVNPKMSLGAGLNFKGANYTKRRDLRYKTSYSLLDFTLSAAYRPIEGFDVGFAYTYTQEVEGIIFSLYGVGNETYSELISFGGFWGIASTYTSTAQNYVKNSRQPYISKMNRFALQMSYDFKNGAILYTEGYIRPSSGHYGLETQSSVLHTTNDNSSVGASLNLTLSGKSNRHLITAKYDKTTMENYRTVWQENNYTSGSSEIIYYDPVSSGNSTQSYVTVNYVGYLGCVDNEYAWKIEANNQLYNRETLAIYYPFYRTTELYNNVTTLDVQRNIRHKNNTYNIGLGIGYNLGGGDMYTDGTYATPGSEMQDPRVSTEFIEQEWDYLTSTQIIPSLKLGYATKFKENSYLYTELNYSFRTQLDGDKNYQSVGLKVGLNF